MAEDLMGLYRRLGLQKAALLGHSMGGRAMMAFALKYVSMCACGRILCTSQ